MKLGVKTTRLDSTTQKRLERSDVPGAKPAVGVAVTDTEDAPVDGEISVREDRQSACRDLAAPNDVITQDRGGLTMFCKSIRLEDLAKSWFPRSLPKDFSLEPVYNPIRHR